MNPLVSVIIPVYNMESFLAETLQSVLNLDYPNLEVILVDDGSKDSSLSVAESFASRDGRIKIFSQANTGVCKARNLAIARASGEFILPVDADDLIEPDYISKAVPHFSDEEVKVVLSNADFFGDSMGKWTLPPFDLHLLAHRNMLPATAMYRKSDWERVGGYCEEIIAREDWDFWISLLKEGGKVVRLPEVLLHYRIRPHSKRIEDRRWKRHVIDVLNERHPEFFMRELGGPLHYRRSWSVVLNRIHHFFHPKRIQLHPDYVDMYDFVQMIPAYFRLGKGKLLYKGRNELREFDVNGTKMIVKSFARPNWINKIAYAFFRPSKARRSFEYAILLTRRGIGTPCPVGYCTCKKGLLFSDSYYVSLKSSCPYTYRHFADPEFTEHLSLGDRRRILEAIADTTAQLHDAGYYHKDYSAGNILFDLPADNNARIPVEIVDLNRIRFGPVNEEKGCRNFDRLPGSDEMAEIISERYAQRRGFSKSKCRKWIARAMKSTKIWLAASMLLLSQSLTAVVAYPGPFEVRQKDGTVMQIRIVGDEFFHYAVDMSGNLVEKGPDGFYHYAEMMSDGSVSVSSRQMTSDRPMMNGLSLPVGLIERANALRSEEKSRLRQISTSVFSLAPLDNTDTSSVVIEDPEEQTVPMTWRDSVDADCTHRSLVILVNFSDVRFVVKNPQDAFDSMLNKSGYSYRNATGSARDYFMDNSHGLYRPAFDVYGPFDLPKTMAEYGANEAGVDIDRPGFAADAVAAAYAGGVDFSKYDADHNGILDNLFIFYAGYSEAEGGHPNSIWPYSSSLASMNISYQGVKITDYACSAELRGYSGQNMAGIGVFCHEHSHTLGLPDLYDTDYSASGGESLALGTTSLMSSGTYNNDTHTPPHFNAEELSILGWLDPIPLTDGHLELPSIESNVAYRFDTDNSGEYFIFENRQQKGWDAYIPGHGLLIYHVDRSTSVVFNGMSAMYLWAKGGINNYPAHECMDLLEADGQTTAGGFFPGKNSEYQTFSYQTKPSFRSWSGIQSPYCLTNITETDGVISTDVVYVPVVSKVSGYVRDEVSQAGLPQVAITITHLTTGKVYTAITNSRGYYEIDLPIGRYRFSSKSANYKTNNVVVVLTDIPLTNHIRLVRQPCVEHHTYKNIHICASEFPFMYEGSLFTEPGEYDFHYQVPPFDCDSTHTLVLTATYLDTSVIQNKHILTLADTTASCQWMYLNGEEGWLDIEGATERSYVAVRNGQYAAWLTKDSCHSMSSVCLVDCFCENLFEQFDTITVCATELPILYRDSVLEAAGDYRFLYYTSRLRCDSTYYLHVIVPEFDITVIQTEMLLQSADSSAAYQWLYKDGEGDWVEIAGATDSVFAAEHNGQYAVRLTKALCSVMSEVSIVDCFCGNLFTQYDTMTVCASELPLLYRDSVLEAAGDYEFHYYTTRLGCDSIYYLHLEVTSMDVRVSQNGNILTSLDSMASHQWLQVLDDGSYIILEGADSKVFTAFSNGRYILRLELNQCQAYSEILQVDNICEGPYYSFDTLNIAQNELPFVYGGTLIDSEGDYELHFVTEPYHCDSTLFLTVLTTQIVTTVSVNDNILTAKEKNAQYQWMKYDSEGHLRPIEGATGRVYEAQSNGRYVLKLTENGFTDRSDVLIVSCFCTEAYYTYDTLTVKDGELPVQVEGRWLNGPGRYDFVHTGRFGCDSIRVLQLNVIDGIRTAEMESAFSVAPNPTDGWLIVRHPGMQGRIVICDVLGVELKEFPAPSDPSTIELDVPAGMYLVVFESSGKRFVRRVIKQ